MSTTKMITDAIKDASKAKTKAYDTTATVKRVEGSTVWVHIPGGVDETPVKRTINAGIGDTVQVRVSDGSAWLVGNASAPPTDDTRANSAMIVATDANALAESASKAATEAWGYAGRARDAAEQAEATAEGVESIAVAAEQVAQNAQNSLKSVVQGATTVEKAVSVMQTALEAVAEYDPNAITETFTGDGTETDFTLQTKATNILSVAVDGESAEYATAVVSGVTVVTITPAPENNASISISYDTTKEWFWHDANGAHVLGDDNGYRNDIASTGMKVMDVTNEVSVAEFGANGAQIGQSGGAHSVIDVNGQKLYANDGTKLIAHLGYNKSQSVAERAPYFILGERGAEVYSAQKTYYWGDVVEYNDRYYLCIVDQATTPPTGASWDTLNYTTFYYTTVEGYQNMSAKSYCHAEGYKTVSSNSACHSEGWQTVSGGFSSHAEGCESRAAGAYSHAQNYSTRASKRAQTSIGTYNTEDTSTTTTHPSGDTSYGEYALIVGNGTANDARSNALTVDWFGDVCLALDTTAQSGTTDGDLYASITALGWQSDVIV